MSYAEKRHHKILELLNSKEQIEAAELMELFNTSRETVRRDLNELAAKGLLIKTHGGAISLEHNATPGFFTNFKNRKNANQSEKLDLCRYAAKSVKEYDTIFIDNSTTTAHIVNFIPNQYKLTFLTNSINLIAEFALLHNPGWTVISLGGVLDYSSYSVNRFLAVNNLQYFKPNRSFISCHGIDEDLTATDTYIDDVEIKRYIVQTCKETFLLADSSKMKRQSVVKIADTSDFHRIITNENVDPAFFSKLISHGCNVELAPGKHSK